jgi:hypothetical protein
VNIVVKERTGTPVTRPILPTLVLATVMGIVFGFSATIAHAHGGGPGLTYDPCIQHTDGDNFIHLAVYQPQFNPFAEYCNPLPRAGRSLLVFDLIGADLPQAPISLTVSSQGRHFLIALPPQSYRSGVADLPVDLPAGEYTVTVGIDELGENHRIGFPLTVGEWWGDFVAPVVMILLIVAIAAGYCVSQTKLIKSERRRSRVTNSIELIRISKR